MGENPQDDNNREEIRMKELCKFDPRKKSHQGIVHEIGSKNWSFVLTQTDNLGW